MRPGAPLYIMIISTNRYRGRWVGNFMIKCWVRLSEIIPGGREYVFSCLFVESLID